MSNLFSNLIYLVEKSVREKCEIFNLAKLYYQIIQKMDYFTIVDTHFKIIEMLKKHLDIPGVAHQLDLIRAVYVTKKWSRYLDWFE